MNLDMTWIFSDNASNIVHLEELLKADVQNIDLLVFWGGDKVLIN